MLRHKIQSIALLAIVSLFLSNNIIAQNCLPSLAHDSMQLVTDGVVYCSETKGDTMFIGGDFSYIGKYSGGLGIVDTAGNFAMPGDWPRVHGYAYTMEPDGTGGYYIGGNFNKIGDSVRSNIAHINSSGQVTAFKVDITNGTNVYVSTIAKSGNRLYIGGNFLYVNNRQRKYAVCINLSGNTITRWDPSLSSKVNKILLHDSVAYVAGAFTGMTYEGGSTNKYLVAVDTSLGQRTSWNPAPNAEVLDLYIDNSTMYVAGQFTSISGQNRTCLASFNLSTGFINLWNPVLTGPTGMHVNSICIMGNKAYFGGDFTKVGNAPIGYTASVDKYTGQANTAWKPGGLGFFCVRAFGNIIYLGGMHGTASYDSLGNAQSWSPSANVVGNKGIGEIVFGSNRIYLLGEVNSVCGMQRRGLAAFNYKTNDILSYNPFVFNSSYYVKALKRAGDIMYIGGSFPTIKGKSHTNIAAYSIGGDSVYSWNPGSFGGTSTVVNTIEKLGSAIYIGGSFTSVGGNTRNNICAIDSATATKLSWAPNANAPVNVIKEKGNSLFVGGSFTAIGGQSRSRVAAVNLAGTTLQWNPGNQTVNDIDFIGNAAYISGINGVRKIDTTTANSSPPVYTWNKIPTGTDVYSLLYYGDKVYTAGDDRHLGGGVDTSASNTQSTMNLGHYGIIYNVNHVDSTLYAFGGIQSVNNEEKMLTGMVRLNVTTKVDTPVVTITGPANICNGAGQKQLWYVNTNMQNPSFSWYRNGGLVVSPTGVPTAEFDVFNSNKIVCVATAGTGCYVSQTKASDTSIVTTSAIINTTGSITGPTKVCSSVPSTFVMNTNFTPSSYRWSYAGVFASNDTNVYSFTPSATSSLYCYASVPDSGCYSNNVVSGMRFIGQIVSQITPTKIIGLQSISHVCEGDPVYYFVSTNTYTGNYQWSINGVNTGLNDDSLFIPSVGIGDTVKCVVTFPVPNCYTFQTWTSPELVTDPTPDTIATTNVTSNIQPVICDNAAVTLTANTTVSWVWKYDWYHNGTYLGPSFNGKTYSYTATPGVDTFVCVVFPYSGCYAPDTVASSELVLTTEANKTPTINISGPATVGEFAPVNLTANINNAGSNYSIEWKKNGITFANTTTNTTSYIKAAGVDNIIATITPVGCYSSATSSIHTIAESVGVKAIGTKQAISIYPNPFRNEFRITGVETGDKLLVYDLLSRKALASWEINPDETEHTYSLNDLAPGVYILEVVSMEGVKKSSLKLHKY